MRVRIICYEDIGNWILGKFATKLNEELRQLSVEADIAGVPDPNADVNHHIIYIDYDGKRSSLDTVMVTHIDADWKFRKLRRQLEAGATGICMSSDTMKKLTVAGIASDRVCFISPPHDEIIKPRPLVIGIATRIYPDGRKREHFLTRLADRIDPADFAFRIMGEGWDRISETLRHRGFSVEYYHTFDPAVYSSMIPSLDYYLYLGCDEGSLGFVDALSAGVPTIATPQGYHLDAIGGLTHPFETEEELRAVFEGIALQRRTLVNSVSQWTWRNYAKKHLDLWTYLRDQILPKHISYPDGVASLMTDKRPAPTTNDPKAVRLSLIRGSLRQMTSLLKSSLRKRVRRSKV